MYNYKIEYFRIKPNYPPKPTSVPLGHELIETPVKPSKETCDQFFWLDCEDGIIGAWVNSHSNFPNTTLFEGLRWGCKKKVITPPKQYPTPEGWYHLNIFDIPTKENCDGWMYEDVVFNAKIEAINRGESYGGKRWLLRKSPEVKKITSEQALKAVCKYLTYNNYDEADKVVIKRYAEQE